jgi:leucyl-tRNA synthetase
VYVADYVLMRYGTGAIMAVPAEDERDWDFALLHGLPVVRTTRPPTDSMAGPGPVTGSRRIQGSSTAWMWPRPRRRAIEWLEAEGIGRRMVNYRLRDWLVSRQRFWGCPIPIVYCPEHGPWVSPRTSCRCWRPTMSSSCPPASRPSPGIPPFATRRARSAGARPSARRTRWTPSSTRRGTSCVSAIPGPRTSPSIPDIASHFMPVDQYIGGIEHAILHLLYARFYTRALIDVGWPRASPASRSARLFTQGMIRLDHKKMSKSKGNLIAPTKYFDTVGADALRLFHLFAGPPGDDMDWSAQTDEIIEGCARFLDRVWRS